MSKASTGWKGQGKEAYISQGNYWLPRCSIWPSRWLTVTVPEAEIKDRSLPSSAKVPSTPTLEDLVPAQAPHVAPIELAIPPLIPNILKGDGLQNILEEKIQLIEVLEGMYANVRVDATFTQV